MAENADLRVVLVLLGGGALHRLLAPRVWCGFRRAWQQLFALSFLTRRPRERFVSTGVHVRWGAVEPSGTSSSGRRSAAADLEERGIPGIVPLAPLDLGRDEGCWDKRHVRLTKPGWSP